MEDVGLGVRGISSSPFYRFRLAGRSRSRTNNKC